MKGKDVVKVSAHAPAIQLLGHSSSGSHIPAAGSEAYAPGPEAWAKPSLRCKSSDAHDTPNKHASRAC